MSLSLIIPVHNEENQIKTTLNRLIKFHKTFKDLEIIFINDFSTDDTKKIIKKIQKKRKFLKYFENKKKGLGSAIQTGITNSRKKFVCIFMADMSDDLKDVKKYYLKINNNKLDAVLGTRFSSKSKVSNYPLFKLVLNRIFNTFVKLLFFTNYNDFTNAFKIYKKKNITKTFTYSFRKF